jgi:hypothetical protein
LNNFDLIIFVFYIKHDYKINRIWSLVFYYIFISFKIFKEIFFRAFDICLGERSLRRYFNDYQFAKALEIMGIDSCPAVYKGPYSKEKINELTHNQNSNLCQNQISEGVVVRPVIERNDERIPTMKGRVILKSINEAYLLRKNKNATEFQ